MKPLLILLLLASITHNVSANTIKPSASPLTISAITQLEFEQSMISKGFLKTARAFIKPETITSVLVETTKTENECLALLETYDLDEKNEAQFTDLCMDRAY